MQNSKQPAFIQGYWRHQNKQSAPVDTKDINNYLVALVLVMGAVTLFAVMAWRITLPLAIIGAASWGIKQTW